MKRAAKTDHVHKYKRFDTVYGKQFWRCLIPGCPHVIYDSALLLARQHQCWLCGEVITITEPHLQQIKPVCENCKQYRKVRKQAL